MRFLLVLSALIYMPALCFCQIKLNKTRLLNLRSYKSDTFQHHVTTINIHTKLYDFFPCDNSVIISDEASDDFHPGDTVVIIQMGGAIIDSSNSPNFGNILDYKNAGNYEFNYVKDINGRIVQLQNKLLRQYDIPNGQVQMLRVPYFKNFTINSGLSTLAWDGEKGGVLVIDVQDTLTLNADIDVSRTGFVGGRNLNIHPNTLSCSQTDYYYDTSSWHNGAKGNGITWVGYDKRKGRGKLANGGGGGNGHNAGGGGGGNYSGGGFGGYQLDSCGNAPFDNRGIGGAALNYNNGVNKIFMGGGGGAGHNDGTDTSFFASPGGDGAGIIIIKAKYFVGNGHTIFSNGSFGETCALPFENCHNDGMGGGGAGGTVLIEIANIIDTISVNVQGGNGNNAGGYLSPNYRVGPGGGGSGGVVWFANATVPLNSKVYKNGGINGVILADSNNPWGATAGSDGVVISNLSIPIDSVLFAPNIDSVGITDSFNCNNFYFKGFAHTNTRPITSWKWYFGDGDSGIVQNPLHTYLSAGTFTVQLIVTDANGCQDSASVNVNSYILNITAGPPKTICANSSTVLQATNNGGTQFAWSPAQYLNDSTLLNPIAAPPATTMYHLVAASGSGCTKTDSVLITVHSPGIFAVNPPANICQNDSIQLLASGGDVYLWNPGNLTVSNPVVSPLVTTTYSVRISDTACHVNGNLSTTISVLQLPLVLASKSNDIDCGFDFSQLNATGAVSYVWSPASSLSNPLIANPIAKPAFQTLYTVKGKGANGCVRSDTITVYIKGIGDAGYKMPSAFTPNGDGLNDCYGIKYWGLIQELDFSIYNRWGQRVFHTKTPGDCWDGTFKGEKQNPDVFVYIINAKTNCGKIFRKGTFLLIR